VLTKKQLLFCQEYLIDLNATQAAIRAGYSPKNAYSQGFDNLKKPAIALEVQRGMDAREKRTGITADNVLRELAKLAFSNIRDFASWQGQEVRFADSDGLTEGQAACISEISQTVTQHGGSFKIKLHDKKGSLELLGRHLKLFTDKIEHSGDPENPIQLAGAIDTSKLSDEELETLGAIIIKGLKDSTSNN